MIVSQLLLKLREFNCFNQSLYSILEEFDFPCLDSLMVIYIVIMHCLVVSLGFDDAPLEQTFAPGAGFNEFGSDLAAVASVNDDSFVVHFVCEHGLHFTVEHYSVVVELLNVRGSRQVGAGLVAILAQECLGKNTERVVVRVLELDYR